MAGMTSFRTWKRYSLKRIVFGERPQHSSCPALLPRCQFCFLTSFAVHWGSPGFPLCPPPPPPPPSKEGTAAAPLLLRLYIVVDLEPGLLWLLDGSLLELSESVRAKKPPLRGCFHRRVPPCPEKRATWPMEASHQIRTKGNAFH